MTYKDFLWYLFTTIASLLILAYLFSTPISNAYAPTVEKKITWRDTLNNYPVLKALASCESGVDPSEINPMDTNGLPSIGLFQYQQKTWDWWTSIIDPNKSWDIMNPYHQIQVTLWAFEQGYQHHWGCWKKINKI
jgi:hypothetical protein